MHYNGRMSTRQTAPRDGAAQRLRGCTCSRLRRLTRRLTAIYDRALAPCGLRVTQYSLMSFLHGSNTAMLSALAEALDLDRTTLTRNLQPLLAAGWIALEAGADSRARIARLTPRGAAKWAEARPLWRRAQDQVNATLGSAEVARLHERIDHYLPQLRPAPGKEQEDSA